MKNRIHPFCIYIVFFTVTCLFTACKNAPSPESVDASNSDYPEASTTNTNSSNNGVVKFKMDGVDWVSGPPGHPELKFEEEATTDGKKVVRIEAFGPNGSHMALTVYDADGIRTGISYPVPDQGNTGFYKDDFQGPNSYLTVGVKDNTGKIKITSLSKEKVVGTFEFLMRNAGDPEDIRSITAGEFDVRFTTY